ncbi:MAG TPA: hypothetical protein VGK04_03950 [Thermoanaerobaculia bacterium]|jgi:hypothetical protein
MSGFTGSPRLLKAGIVLLDPVTSAVLRIIPLQYNPDLLTRTLQVKGTAVEAGDRLEAQRLIGPPVETIKLDAEIDATDQLEFPRRNTTTVEVGIQPLLSALETLVYPTSADLQAENRLANSGSLEVVPMESPLTLFVWSKNRIVPVRITEFNIVEEAFDPALNPIRAKVSLGMRVLSVNDLPFDHKGNSLFLAYQQQKERLAGKNAPVTLAVLGVNGI